MKFDLSHSGKKKTTTYKNQKVPDTCPDVHHNWEMIITLSFIVITKVKFKFRTNK